MKKLMMATVLPLAGCGAITLDGHIDEQERALLDAGRTFAVTQIVAFNQAGVDPLNLNQQQLTYASLGCGLLAAGSALIAAEDPTIAQEVTTWCGIFMQAAE